MSDAGPVLVVTNLDDPTADVVITELHDRGVPVVRFDSGDFPHALSVAATITSNGVEGTLSTPSRTADLAQVRSLYYRRPSGFAFPHLDKQDARFALTQARYGLGGVLASLPGCLYVNHPHRIGDAEFKPSGLAAAAAVGLRFPPTLITADADVARAFIKQYAPVIYKPLSAPLYRIDGVSCTVEVADVTAEEIGETALGTAHLFQRRIEKTADVRVTVIGDRVFPVRIDSGLLDWRTDYSRLHYSVVTPPPGIAEALHAYLAHFGLVFGAFDFAIDRQGQWWFLECNPSGQWYWLEPETGLPMLAATADLLERKRCR
ncbi:ATP-grasp ribosomal peptide maturase, SAV_5884 family [Streptomyces sp. DI166]|uniref:ATP-grasp ribosomal peptide maturase n=1 Tax=Streptomyces sp. DI166 TaxID=1839783 RepID=UPI0007F44BC5|nr:ATP-grasp ribosomal peptide maturase [Streptomyces sp. DI166]SBT90471.1 ATP-grasp ribosomal peptide maturase, SAV_5884 family [Streptomyces sp. DI166]